MTGKAKAVAPDGSSMSKIKSLDALVPVKSKKPLAPPPRNPLAVLPYEPKYLIQGPNRKRAPDALRNSVFIKDYDRCWSAERALQQHSQLSDRARAAKLHASQDSWHSLSEAHESQAEDYREPPRTLQKSATCSGSLAQSDAPGSGLPEIHTDIDQISNTTQPRFNVRQKPVVKPFPIHPCQWQAPAASRFRRSPEERAAIVQRLSQPRKRPKELVNLPAIGRPYKTTYNPPAECPVSLATAKVSLRLREALPLYRDAYQEEARRLMKNVLEGEGNSVKGMDKQIQETYEARRRSKEQKVLHAFRTHLVAKFGTLERAWDVGIDVPGEGAQPRGALDWPGFVVACQRPWIQWSDDLKPLYRALTEDDNTGFVRFSALYAPGFDVPLSTFQASNLDSEGVGTAEQERASFVSSNVGTSNEEVSHSRAAVADSNHVLVVDCLSQSKSSNEGDGAPAQGTDVAAEGTTSLVPDAPADAVAVPPVASGASENASADVGDAVRVDEPGSNVPMNGDGEVNAVSA